MEINLKDLFVQILTQEDIDELSDVVDYLLKSAYKMDKDIQEVTLDFPTKYAKTIENFFTSTHRNRYDPIEFTNGLKELILLLDKVEKVTITIAIEPTYKLIQDISSWFYHNLDQKVVLKINVERDIVAGMTISYNGKFKDYSYAPTFLDKLEKDNGNV